MGFRPQFWDPPGAASSFELGLAGLEPLEPLEPRAWAAGAAGSVLVEEIGYPKIFSIAQKLGAISAQIDLSPSPSPRV